MEKRVENLEKCTRNHDERIVELEKDQAKVRERVKQFEHGCQFHGAFEEKINQIIVSGKENKDAIEALKRVNEATSNKLGIKINELCEAKAEEIGAKKAYDEIMKNFKYWVMAAITFGTVVATLIAKFA